mgnify:CR=1 FL=1
MKNQTSKSNKTEKTATAKNAPAKTLTALNVENLKKTSKEPTAKTETKIKPISNLYAKSNPAYIELLAKYKKESKVRAKIRKSLDDHCTAINIAFKKSKNAPKDNELKKDLDNAITAFRAFTALYYAQPNSCQIDHFRTFKEDDNMTAIKKDSNAAIVTCFAHLKELSK